MSDAKDKPKTETTQALWKLNVWQTVFLGVAALGPLIMVCKGALNLPDRVDTAEKAIVGLQAAQTNLMTLPLRLDALEKSQTQLWKMKSEDHDLLLKMSQALDDLKAQSAETRSDLKDLKKQQQAP